MSLSQLWRDQAAQASLAGIAILAAIPAFLHPTLNFQDTSSEHLPTPQEPAQADRLPGVRGQHSHPISPGNECVLVLYMP